MATTGFIASDAIAPVDAFRAAGAVSHHKMPLQQARDAYARACIENGIVADGTVARDELRLESTRVPVRRYRVDSSSHRTAAVVFIHGGGWVMGSVETHDQICAYIAENAEVTVLSVDYRLAPEHPYPAAYDDCADVVDAVLTNGARYGIDSDRVVLFGDSAGGQIAASLARIPQARRLAGVVLVYPVADLTMQGASHQEVTGFPLVHDTMQWFVENYVPAGIDLTREELSPGLHPIPPWHPAAFIATVQNDPLRSEGRAYAEALDRAGVLARSIHYPGHHHGLLTSAGAIPTGHELLDEITRFIRDRISTQETQ